MKKFLLGLMVLFSTLTFGQNQTLTGIKTFTSPPKFLNLAYSGTNTKFLTLSASNQLQWSSLSALTPVTPTFSQVLAAGNTRTALTGSPIFVLNYLDDSSSAYANRISYANVLSGNGSTAGINGFYNDNLDGRLADLGFSQGLRLRSVAGGGIATIKATNVTANTLFELPDAPGTLITTGGTPTGFPITGNFEVHNDFSIGTASDYGIQFDNGTSSLGFYNVNARATLSSTSGFGITTSTYPVYIKSDNLTALRTLQAPDEPGTLLVDAPSDGTEYVRKNNAWINSASGSTPNLGAVLTAGHAVSTGGTDDDEFMGWTSTISGSNKIMLGYNGVIVGPGFNGSSLDFTKLSKVSLVLGNGGTSATLTRNVSQTSGTNVNVSMPAASGTLATVKTTVPTTSTDPGFVGEIRADSSFVYVCIATNTWMRAALSTF